ncbi:MAG: DUF951 domain-containing protein [Acholeplasma sp.]|nr:DUF951 domain-containing protein [Acholeplasma sp.]
MRYQIDDLVTFKKKHACGSFEWKIVKIGADIKLECLGCGRNIVLLPIDIDKRKKK